MSYDDAHDPRYKEEYEKVATAALAVVAWWRPESAKTRSFKVWFDEVLPDLRESLGLPRSMADDVPPGRSQP